MQIPEEIQRREQRLGAIAAAKAKIEARAKQRYESEQAQYEAKMAARKAKQAAGKRPGGKEPKAPEPGPRPQDQVNLTDEDSRIMPVRGSGFEQSYNAQALVDCESMLVLATGLTQAPNDQGQIAPMVDKLQHLPEELRTTERVLADTGYYSEANVQACVEAKIEPLLAPKREAHHPHWKERFSEPPPLAQGASAVEKMQHTLNTRAGRAVYALRKQTVEPVFGIIKSVMGFRQFLLRGLDNVRNEWTLVCLAWNLKRMAVLRPNCVHSG